MTYLNDSLRKGFLSELVDLCVADSRESFFLARLAVELLVSYGDSC
jgi:hypothetical protein